VLRPWKISLAERVNRERSLPVYQQIVQALIHDIQRGRLLPGSFLPSSRELAVTLGVNRKTIVLAYDDLVAQGWLASDGTRGTMVSDSLPELAPQLLPIPQSDIGYEGAAPEFKIYPAADPLPAFVENSALTFDDGAPDARLLSPDVLSRAYRTALRQAARGNWLGYGDPRGSPILREIIANMLTAHRGLVANADNICITRGSQMAIFLAARILVRPGETVVVEALSYSPAWEAFRAAGATVIGAKLDENGLDIDDLENLCRQHKVRALYLTPHHQFPTTVSLTPQRRLRLLDLAGQFGLAIIEDDYDHEFHFEQQPLLPIASYAPRRTIYVGSMSKLLLPGLRIGYVAAAPDVIRLLANETVIIDRQGNVPTELAVAELIQSGELHRHSRKALQVYLRRRNAFAQLLRDNFGDAIDFKVPDGGLAFWVKFRDPAVLDVIERDSPSCGVRFLPSRTFAITPHKQRGLRLGYASHNVEEAAEAVRRLRRAADKALRPKMHRAVAVSQ
jgi:GntR family transcriptional regulator / MocR family aminotransferase